MSGQEMQDFPPEERPKWMVAASTLSAAVIWT